MKHSDTAVVVTTFCGEPDIELKKHILKMVMFNSAAMAVKL